MAICKDCPSYLFGNRSVEALKSAKKVASFVGVSGLSPESDCSSDRKLREAASYENISAQT